MPCPDPALIGGPGVSELLDGVWCARGRGGRLFIADGLIDISYGPCDIVMLDGWNPHGITTLCDLAGKGQASRMQLDRFSVIIFSTFKRMGMCKHGNYDGTWQHDWRDAVHWQPGFQPVHELGEARQRKPASCFIHEM